MTAPDYGRECSDHLREIQQHARRRRSPAHPFLVEGSCLMVIDMQRFFMDPRSHASFPGAEGICDNVLSILGAFRSRGLPVVFTKHALLSDECPGMMGEWWGDVLRAEDPLSAIDDRLRPLVGEKVVRKTRYSAFMGTELEAVLEGLNATRLVITGVQTHLCCESTAREAFMRDYEVFFVVDATAANDADLHLGSLRALATGFATLSTTEEMIKWLAEGK
jgi:bifunctional isochorismate lyase/aryl carrier protein